MVAMTKYMVVTTQCMVMMTQYMVVTTQCGRSNARVDQKISDDWISSDTDGPVFVLPPRM